MYSSPKDNGSKTTDALIDLRSDTVTKPSPEMRRAMFEAEVGDDVYGEDPTINRLEKRAAEIFGREAALFVPSGTMGNQIAIKLHTHSWAGGHLRGARPRLQLRDGDDGALLRRGAAHGVGRGRHPHLGARAAEAARARAITRPRPAWSRWRTRTTWPAGPSLRRRCSTKSATSVHAAGLPVHLDGARVFNASVALGIPVAQADGQGRHGDVLPVEGTGRAGGIDAGGQRGVRSIAAASIAKRWAAACGRRAFWRPPD